MSKRNILIAYNICREVLSQVGQNIPETVYMYQTTAMTKTAARMVEGLSDKDLLAMKEMESQLATVMSFYAVMMRAAFYTKPEMLPFLACRMVQLTIENGLCMHSLTGFIVLAALLCKKSMGDEIDILCGTKIGKAVMSCLSQRYNAEKIPVTYSLYYGFVAWHISEPLQICVEKLRQGFEIGMSLGESHTAFYNSAQQVAFAILAGERLPNLLEKVDYHLGLANIYKDDFGKICFSSQRHTIEILISGGESWWMDIKLQCLALLPAKLLENLYFFSALKTYWQGHNKRCKYYVEKMLAVIATSNNSLAGPQYHFIVLINCLNTFELMKSHQTPTAKKKLKSTAVKALKELKVASEYLFELEFSKQSEICPLFVLIYH